MGRGFRIEHGRHHPCPDMHPHPPDIHEKAEEAQAHRKYEIRVNGTALFLNAWRSIRSLSASGPIWVRGTLFSIPVPLVEEGDVGVPGMDPRGVGDAGGDVVAVPPAVGVLDPGHGQVQPPLEDDGELALVAVLGQLGVLGELHEEDLVVCGLGDMGREAAKGDVGLRQPPDGLWEDVLHLIDRYPIGAGPVYVCPSLMRTWKYLSIRNVGVFMVDNHKIRRKVGLSDDRNFMKN